MSVAYSGITYELIKVGKASSIPDVTMFKQRREKTREQN